MKLVASDEAPIQGDNVTLTCYTSGIAPIEPSWWVSLLNQTEELQINDNTSGIVIELAFTSESN